MLNEYQQQLVECFADFKVEFLIIGGMALKFHTEKPTRDLDLWVPVDGVNKVKLANALTAWTGRYPRHGPIGIETYHLKENLQIHYPQYAVYFINSQNKPYPISPDDGVDILTSVHADLSFEVAISRSSEWSYKNITLQVASAEDAELLARFKAVH